MILNAVCRDAGIPAPVEEYRFHPTRKWRFDFAWPEDKLALEVEGGVYTQGRHNRATGFLRDIEKYNEAARLGWTVIRATPPDVDRRTSYVSQNVIQTIKELIT